jgi:hypothetical protein
LLHEIVKKEEEEEEEERKRETKGEGREGRGERECGVHS